MKVQVIVVVFAASVSLVHTRHVIDTGAYRHATVTDMQHAHIEANTKSDSQGSVMPKMNEQQSNGAVNSETETYQLRTNQNSGMRDVERESAWNQYENLSSEPQGDQFTVKAIKARTIDDRAFNDNYEVTDRNAKLTYQQSRNKTRVIEKNNNIYKDDNTIKSTTSGVNHEQNRQTVREIVRKPIKFEQRNDDYNPDRIVFGPDMNDNNPDYQENSIYNGIVTPPTKLFTNKHNQTPITPSITEMPDLEDRVAITGEKCPTGQTKIVGSDRCVKVDT